MKYSIHQHRFGVNYTPTHAWYYGWNDFQPDEIARDLDSIVHLGADHIRLMLIWPYFQPNPQTVSDAHLARLDTLMQTAAQRELEVVVSLFTGWLSGYSFKPPFQQDHNFYDLGQSAPPQELYLRTVAQRMRAHSNFLGFDLGNELNCCWQTPDLTRGDQWSGHMLALAREVAPGGVHANGVDHQPWFQPATFSPQHLAQAQEIIPLHCWTYFTGALQRSGSDCLHPRPLHLLASMAALARAYAGDAQKPIWVQEFGMVPDWTDPANIPAFVAASIRNAIDAGVSWFTWWSSHDIDTRYAFDPLEYAMGLMTNDRKLKPHAYVFKELAESFRGKAVMMPSSPASAPPKIHHMDSVWAWLDDWVGIAG